MFSRRNLLSALAGIIPSALGLRFKLVDPPDIRIDSPVRRTTFLTYSNETITLLDDHCYCVERGGTTKYYYCHILHREGLPAVIKANGEEDWYLNGQLHRVGGPAQTHLTKNSDGSPNRGEYWYQNGRIHREDGPAVIYEDGHKEWKINGEWHRVDGPAIIWPNGTRKWYQNDQLHRLDGPAIEEVGKDRSQEWWINGKRHRSNGPAKIQFYRDETIRQEWWVDGKLHREDGPAVEDTDGAKYWYKHGVHLQSVNKHGVITFSDAYNQFSLMQI